MPRTIAVRPKPPTNRSMRRLRKRSVGKHESAPDTADGTRVTTSIREKSKQARYPIPCFGPSQGPVPEGQRTTGGRTYSGNQPDADLGVRRREKESSEPEASQRSGRGTRRQTTDEGDFLRPSDRPGRVGDHQARGYLHRLRPPRRPERSDGGKQGLTATDRGERRATSPRSPTPCSTVLSPARGSSAPHRNG